MKTLLIVKEKDFDWIRPAFPTQPPLLTKICNKPLLEYLMDFAILCGSREIRLVSDTPLQKVEASFGNGDRWGVELTYALIRETDGLDETLQKNNRFCSNARLIVMEGCFFVYYDKKKDYTDFIQAQDPCELMACATGRILLQAPASVPPTGPKPSTPPLALDSVRSVNDLHRLSLEVLSGHAHKYVLPGYNNESNVFIGQNVTIAKSAKISPPVMIGNYVQIHKNAVIGPGAVIGNHVIIDANTLVQNTVILDKTYVGEHIELTRKLVAGNAVVDPEKETVVQFEDPHLLSDTMPHKQGQSLFQRLYHGLLAALMAAMLAVPYALLSLILKWQNRWFRQEMTYYADSSGKTICLAHISINQSGWTGRLATAMALDRFPLLGRVIWKGDLALIGTRPLAATEENHSMIEEEGTCLPGVFSYAEAEDWSVSDTDQGIIERFHLAHRNLIHDVVMVAKALSNQRNKGKTI